MTISADIMTVGHPGWEEFCALLEGPAGCNFLEGEDGKITWKCGGGNDQSLAEGILREMGGIDIPASLEYLHKHGGHCDCEILFNVEDSARGSQ